MSQYKTENTFDLKNEPLLIYIESLAVFCGKSQRISPSSGLSEASCIGCVYDRQGYVNISLRPTVSKQELYFIKAIQ